MEALQWILSAGTNFFEGIQLSNDLHRLRATLPKARMLICRSEWGMFKDKQLAKLLSHLKDTTYDAEDLLRQLDDQVLRQRIEDADRSRAGQLLSCTLNLAKSYVCGSKGRIKETQENLDKVVAEIEGMLNLMGLMSVEPSQIMPETSSVISAPEVVGRDGERNALIEMLGVMIGREAQRDQVIKLLGVPLTGGSRRSAGSNGKRAATSSGVASTSRANKQLKGNSGRAGRADISKSNVSVIPIVGIGGVGKTTLAQYIYNDSRVKKHFGLMIWVCVSDFFDKRRITKEIIESIPGEEFNPSCSLDGLHVKLIERLKLCPKFLLVLDDIWPNANKDWEAFYAPLKHGPEGSMILVTTRSPVVATCVTTSNCEPFQLEGLPSDVFWDFFKKCAFGRNDPKSYPHLQDIGQSISSRLCGSPLAAKTLGRLLNMRLTEEHWRTIQKSELWELPHEENEILPALQLSYLYLPEELEGYGGSQVATNLPIGSHVG
ncbi:putative disease resistance protein RGA3 isoform X2 [Miscanthus floridulus]|uniref:putative disease resistance protein RGA3 isoform X2 n=1 Tax=Miscanthus floridulus TaxID=154761 RepID=UPI00345A6601